MYLQRVAEIEPNIRYCAYNIGDDSALKDLMQMRREAGGDMMSGELDVSGRYFHNLMYVKQTDITLALSTGCTPRYFIKQGVPLVELKKKK